MIIKQLMLLSIVASVLLTGVTFAEDGTCDNGQNDVLNAAHAAYEDGDTDAARTLAMQAEALCASNPERFEDAKTLRRSLDPDVTEMFATAEPGMVDLGDYQLFMSCVGEGSPTVIFENGLITPAFDSWRDVQPAISTVTRTCRYDRLGLSPSDGVPSGTIRTTQDQVDDLYRLLELADIEPPYVLVGHSIAGLNIRLFVEQYPELVTGIVLVDASHPEQWGRLAETMPDNADAAPPENFVIPGEELDLVSSAEQTMSIHDFGDRPLVVITAGLIQPGDESFYDIRLELQEETLAYSTNSRHIFAENSFHDVMWSEPNVVIEAVLWVLDELTLTQ